MSTMWSMWNNLSRTERSKLLKTAGLPTVLAQVKWQGLTKSERKKLEKDGKERFEGKKPMATKKGIERKVGKAMNKPMEQRAEEEELWDWIRVRRDVVKKFLKPLYMASTYRFAAWEDLTGDEKINIQKGIKKAKKDGLLDDYYSKVYSKFSVSKKHSNEVPHFDKNIRELVWIEYIGKKMEGYCYCCEIRKITFTNFEVGHNIPISKGGTDEISNLRPVCKQCNSGMRTTVLEEYKRKYFGRNSGKNQ